MFIFIYILLQDSFEKGLVNATRYRRIRRNFGAFRWRWTWASNSQILEALVVCNQSVLSTLVSVSVMSTLVSESVMSTLVSVSVMSTLVSVSVMSTLVSVSINPFEFCFGSERRDFYAKMKPNSTH